MKTLILIFALSLLTASGNLLCQPYYYNSGDPTVLSNWGNIPGGTGTAPSAFGSFTSYIIESGKNVSVNSNWDFVAGGGVLEVSPGSTLTSNSPITLQGCTLRLDSAGTYVHNNAANAAITVFAGNENFNQYSTVKINNWFSASLSLTQLITYNAGFFGNLEINWTSCTGDWYQFLGFQVLCKNDLRITSTGAGRFLPGSIGTSQPNISVKNYYQTGGEVDLSFGSTLNGIATSIEVTRTFEKTGGIIDANGTNAFGVIYFNSLNMANPLDTTYQTFYNAGTLRRVRLHIASLNRFRLLSDMPLTTNNSLCGLIINPSSLLDCGTFHVSGAGPISTSGNVTIKLGSPFGFKTGTEGNITTTGVKTLSQFSDTIEYNGSSAQVTGDSIPFTFPGTIKINNPNGVSLNKSYRIINIVKFINGKLNLENFDLISTVSQTLFNTGINENRFFNTNGSGYYKEYVGFGGQRFFFVGNGTFNPVMMYLTMSSADTMAVRVSNVFSHQPKDSSRCVRKSWSIVESTPGGTSASISTQWIQSSDNGSNFNLVTGTLGKWDTYLSKYVPTRSYLSYPFTQPAFPVAVGFTTNNTQITSFNAGEDFIVGNEQGIYNMYYYNSGDASELSNWKANADGTGLSPLTFDDFTFFKVGYNKNAVFNNPVTFSSKSVVQGYANGQLTSNSPISCYGSFELWDSSFYNHNNNTPAYYTVFAGSEYFSPNSTYNIQMWSDTAQKIYDGVGATFGNLTINFNNLNGGYGGAQWKKHYRVELCKGNLKLIQCSGYYFAPVGYENFTTPTYIGGTLQIGDSALGTYPTFDLSGGSTIPNGQRGPQLIIQGNIDIQSGFLTSQAYPVIAKGSVLIYSPNGKKHTFYSFKPFLFQTYDIGDSASPNIIAVNDTLVLKSNMYNSQSSGFLFKDRWRVHGVLDLDTFSIKSLSIEVASGGKLITRNRNGIDADLTNIQRITFEGNSTLEYAGSETQTFVKAGAYPLLNVANLVINNPNNVIMNIPDVTIHDNLNLINGNLITDSVNYITLSDTAAITNTSVSAIEGPVKINTTPFRIWSFPLRNNNTSRDFVFFAYDFSEWKIRFSNSQQPYGSTLGPGLTTLCQNEFFTVERLSGNAVATIGLGWGRNTGVTNPTNIRVAHWNGYLWEDNGNTGWSGDNDSGFVYSYGVNNFSPFAIASTDGQPLPVEISSFSAAADKNNVKLSWTTTHEINNSGFDIERKSVSDSSWRKVNFVRGSGNSAATVNYSYGDRNLLTGKYKYRLKQIDYNGNFTYYELQNELSVGIPVKFNMSQNYPNPFNPATKINFDLPADAKVTMQIYDITGRLMADLINNESYSAGYHTVQFNGSSFSSGTYFYRISAGEFVQTKKMTLVK